MSETVVEKKPELQTPAKTNKKGRAKAFIIFFTLIAIVAAAGFLYWLHARQFEETDDAQVDAHLNPVTSRIDGTITRVYVDDNAVVKIGDPLVDLDPRDTQVAVDQAQAQVSQARSTVLAQRPNVPITQVQSFTNISTSQADVATSRAAEAAAEGDRATAVARVAQSKANYERAVQDLERDKILIAKEEISQQEYDQAAAAAKAQAAEVEANQSSLDAATRTVEQRKAQTASSLSKLSESQRTAPEQLAIRRASVASEEASAENANAMLEQAKLKLSYTRIAAPVAGIIMKRSAEVGAHIAAGQQLMTIAQVDDVWVTANFKETQLESIRPNQTVSIHVDALKKDFEGYVENIGASTGSVSSVLPPENATGNFVKVVQRIPVRIRFKQNQEGLNRLRPGMSVVPDVHIGN